MCNGYLNEKKAGWDGNNVLDLSSYFVYLENGDGVQISPRRINKIDVSKEVPCISFLTLPGKNHVPNKMQFYTSYYFPNL